MKAIEQRLPKDSDKSFIVFEEIGTYFPCPWHYHPEYELVLVTKSTGRRMVGDHIGIFQEDDLVFMGTMLPHVWVNDSIYQYGKVDHKAEAIVIQFVKDFLGERFMDIPEINRFTSFLRMSDRGMVIKGKTKDRIVSIMKRMPALNGLQRLSALFTIFDLLSTTKEFEPLASPGFIQKFQFDSSERFKKITEYIMHNFDEDIALTEIAAFSNMAVTTFCNFFKKNYRVTFVEYLNSVRIGHACKLLGQENQNIIQVAYESGFNNIANFNRQFRKYKKMTPSEYRRKVVEPVVG